MTASDAKEIGIIDIVVDSRELSSEEKEKS